MLTIDLLQNAIGTDGFDAGWPDALKNNRGRQFLLEHLRDPIAKTTEDQANNLATALAHLPKPLVWGGPALPAPGSITASFAGPATVTAGGSASLAFTLSNQGKADVGRLYGIVQADKGSPLWEGEVLFGSVTAGATVSGILPWAVPPRLYSGEERFTLQLRGPADTPLGEVPVKLNVQGKPRPALAFSWRLLEDENKHVRLTPGTQGKLRLKVLNFGEAPTQKIALRVFKDDDPYVQLGELSTRTLDPVAPGNKDGQTVDVPVQIADELKGKPFDATSITVEVSAQEQFEDRTGEMGRYRAILFATFKVPVGDQPEGEHLLRPPRLTLTEVKSTGANAATVSVHLDDDVKLGDRPAVVTAFLGADKVYLGKSGERDFTFPVQLKPGANNVRVVATDADDLSDALPIRLWGEGKPDPSKDTEATPDSELP